MALGSVSVFHGHRRIDPDRAVGMECRMETTLLARAGTKATNTGFLFLLLLTINGLLISLDLPYVLNIHGVYMMQWNSGTGTLTK